MMNARRYLHKPLISYHVLSAIKKFFHSFLKCFEILMILKRTTLKFACITVESLSSMQVGFCWFNFIKINVYLYRYRYYTLSQRFKIILCSMLKKKNTQQNPPLSNIIMYAHLFTIFLVYIQVNWGVL